MRSVLTQKTCVLWTQYQISNQIEVKKMQGGRDKESMAEIFAWNRTSLEEFSIQ